MKVENPFVPKERGRGCGQSELVHAEVSRGIWGAFRDQNKDQESWSTQGK